MTDQYYRLVDSFDSEEWPFGTDTEEITRLNSVLPGSMEYLVTWDHGELRVDLLEYVGEIDPEVDDD